MKKQALGRGLSALIETEPVVAVGSTLFNEIEISKIHPNPNQPRTEFDDEALEELAASIRANGIISPITLRKITDDNYQIIAGERRYRASKLVGLDKIPAYIRDVDDGQVMEMALIENIQREDLNAVEEALGFKALIDDFSLTQEEVARKMGKSRSAVTNSLRLLALNPDELEALRVGSISAGHARALLACEDEKTRAEMFSLALEGANVRDLEKMAKAENKKPAKKQTKPTFYSEVEISLKNELHRKVMIKPTGKGKGTITFEFFNDDELKEFAKK